jgi:hypothetical protein
MSPAISARPANEFEQFGWTRAVSDLVLVFGIPVKESLYFRLWRALIARPETEFPLTPQIKGRIQVKYDPPADRDS